jgi:hypothetical protein
VKTDDELNEVPGDRFEAALRSLGKSGAVDARPTVATLDAMVVGEPRENGASLSAAHASIMAGALDRLLSRSAQSSADYDPGTPLGGYMRHVRELAGIDLERWAERLGLAPGILRELETTDAGLLRINQPETLAILLDQFEVPVRSFAEAIGAAARKAAAPMRGVSGTESDSAMDARVKQIVSSVSSALVERDRSDLLGNS